MKNRRNFCEKTAQNFSQNFQSGGIRAIVSREILVFSKSPISNLHFSYLLFNFQFSFANTNTKIKKIRGFYFGYQSIILTIKSEPSFVYNYLI